MPRNPRWSKQRIPQEGPRVGYRSDQTAVRVIVSIESQSRPRQRPLHNGRPDVPVERMRQHGRRLDPREPMVSEGKRPEKR